MRPARFVTLCFLYYGAILLASSTLEYGFRVSGESVTRFGLALIIAFVGLYRLSHAETEERSPDEYGLFTYAMAALAVLMTVILLAQLFVS